MQVLAFDIFGTVVDWHGSIVREMAALHPQVDGDAFALAWREGYKPAMGRVMRGDLGWTRIDELHRMILDAGLPWDCVLSAEVFHAYKPDPATYLGVARTFDLRPDQVMLVAAHYDDLAGARRCGLRTAYVERPLEFGAARVKDVSPRAENDMHCANLSALAQALGC